MTPTVVAILTGHALKDTDFILKSQQLYESGVSEVHACIVSHLEHASRARRRASRDQSSRLDCELGPGLRHLAVAVQLYLRLKVWTTRGHDRLEFRFLDHELRGANCIERAFRFLARRNAVPCRLCTSRCAATFLCAPDWGAARLPR